MRRLKLFKSLITTRHDKNIHAVCLFCEENSLLTHFTEKGV